MCYFIYNLVFRYELDLDVQNTYNNGNSYTLDLISCGMQRKVVVYIWITFKPFILNKTFEFEEYTSF